MHTHNLSSKNKKVYLLLTSTLSLSLFLTFIPALSPWFTWLTPPVALFLGVVYALFFKPAFPKFNHKMSKKLLQYSVVALGFGMNLQESIASGKEGMTFTIISVAGTLILGFFIGYRWLKINKNTSYLVSSGTAICGGSAIAAVAPIIEAKEEEISMALGTVFVLNAVALFIFPSIGHLLHLSQQEFGTWSAIAIHDTSSVVGAASAYGEEALKIATTIKLTRALWIIPISIITMYIFRKKGHRIKIPYFIFWFILAIIFNTYVLSDYAPHCGEIINHIGRQGLTLSLFFIGASLSLGLLKKVGIKPFIQGILLWCIISISTLIYICC